MKHKVIHRDTNYIEFVSGIATNKTLRDCKYQAIKDDDTNGWIIYDIYTDEVYSCPRGTLQTMIDTGELITQGNVKYSFDDRLKFGFI